MTYARVARTAGVSPASTDDAAPALTTRATLTAGTTSARAREVDVWVATAPLASVNFQSTVTACETGSNASATTVPVMVTDTSLLPALADVFFSLPSTAATFCPCAGVATLGGETGSAMAESTPTVALLTTTCGPSRMSTATSASPTGRERLAVTTNSSPTVRMLPTVLTSVLLASAVANVGSGSLKVDTYATGVSGKGLNSMALADSGTLR